MTELPAGLADATDSDARGFGYMRLSGGRFDEGGGLPLAAAAELDRYDRLLRRVARHLFLDSNSGRQRVPKGFATQTVLRLAGVESGSVVPVLRQISEDDDALFEGVDYWNQSRLLINHALTSVDKESKLPSDFPLECLNDLASLGRSFRSDEKWELGESKDSAEFAVVSLAVRRKVQRLTQIESLEVETQLIGHVSGVSSDPHGFDFTDRATARKFHGTFVDPAMFTELISIVGYMSRSPLVALSTLVDETDGEIERIRDVLGVESVLPAEASKRLRDLSSLQPGWMQGADAPTEDSVRSCEALLLNLFDEGIRRPAMYPIVEGGIQLEWQTDGFDIEVVIPNSGEIHVDVLDREGEDDAERDFGRNELLALTTFLQGYLR